MSSTSSHPGSPAIERGHLLPGDVFRGHATSSLVAFSVLLASMFFAHSAVVQLSAVNFGEETIRFVENTRTAFFELPAAAERNLASAAAATNYEYGFMPVHSEEHSFEEGLRSVLSAPMGLYAPYEGAGVVSSVLQDVDYNVSTGPNLGLSGAVASSGELAIELGAILRDSLREVIASGKSVLDTIAVAALTFESFITETYVAFIYGLVDTSFIVSETIVVGLYQIGDTIGNTVALAIPTIGSASVETYSILSEELPRLHKSAQQAHIVLGEMVIDSLGEVREFSILTQEQAGERLGIATYGVVEETAHIAQTLTSQATASAADFITLEP